jgi:hypothetical protein
MSATVPVRPVRRELLGEQAPGDARLSLGDDGR